MIGEKTHDPGRRQLLAAAILPGLERLLQPLARKSDSYTDWFNAVEADDANRCRQLLQKGFDPNTIESERFDTGLILAVRHKAWKVFALLLSTKGVQLDVRSRNGDTALMIAAFNSEVAAARSLIEKGAEINRPGWTALHYASAVGNLHIMGKLLEHSAYIDAESPNKTTPLMMAARAGHQQGVQLLLDEGADVTLKNELGLDAIDFARSQEHGSIVRLLQASVDKALAAQKMQKMQKESLQPVSSPDDDEPQAGSGLQSQPGASPQADTDSAQEQTRR